MKKTQFWPVVGWVNHQYVPLQFRVIFHSLIAVGWYLLRLQPTLLYFKFSLSNFTENEIGFLFLLNVIFRGIFLNLRAKSMALTKG